jgi:hypothetical protein
MDRPRAKIGARAAAAVLAIGGAVGAAISAWQAPGLVSQHWIYVVIVAALLWAFVWSVVSGIRLWRGEPRGWKWATILFAAQIPVLTVPGMAYEYYTGVAVKLLGGNTDSSFTLGLGATINVYLDTRITDLVYGVNLFAVLVLAYLLWARPRRATPAPAVAVDGG